MNRELLRQIATFGVCGVASAGAYSGTLVGLVERVGVGTLPATIAGFAVGTAVSYLLNSWLTFRRVLAGPVLVRFVVVTALGGGLNVALVEGVQLAGLHYGWGVLVSLVVAPTFNFVGHRWWTFAEG